MFQFKHTWRRIHHLCTSRQIRSCHYQLGLIRTVTFYNQMSAGNRNTVTCIIPLAIRRIRFSRFRFSYTIVVLIMQYILSCRKVDNNTGIRIITICSILAGQILLLQNINQCSPSCQPFRIHSFLYVHYFISQRETVRRSYFAMMISSIREVEQNIIITAH